MSPEEQAVKMVMLDWPQERVNQYQEFKKEIYDKVVQDFNEAKEKGCADVYVCALSIAYINFAEYVEKNN